jgi:hypothetical protein
MRYSILFLLLACTATAQELTLPADAFAQLPTLIVARVNLSFDMKADSGSIISELPRLSMVRRVTAVIDSAINGPDSIVVKTGGGQQRLLAITNEAGSGYKVYRIVTAYPDAATANTRDAIWLHVYGASDRTGHLRVFVEYEALY